MGLGACEIGVVGGSIHATATAATRSVPPRVIQRERSIRWERDQPPLCAKGASSLRTQMRVTSLALRPSKLAVAPSVQRFLATQQLVGRTDLLLAGEQPIQARLDILAVDVR